MLFKRYKMEAFVYCWTDHLTHKLYVGSHKGLINDGYICSSKPMMEQYKKRPQDFSRQIIAKGDFFIIRKLEKTLLEAANAKHDKNFYNMDNGNGNFYCMYHTEEHNRNSGRASGLARKGKPGHIPWNKGLTKYKEPRVARSQETREKMRKPKAPNRKKRGPWPEEWKQKQKLRMAKWWSDRKP